MLLVERNYSKPVRILEGTAAQLPDGVLLRLIYPVCNIGELNANKRMYERELWDLVLQNQDLQEKLSNRNLYGQAEHPKETASDLQLTSHIIHEMWIGEDSRVYQTMDVLDTPCGRIIECLVRAGSRVGVSTRAEGDLEEAVNEETGEKYHRVVPKSYRYVTTDFTADPSTFGAMAVDVKRNVITAARTAAESKKSKVGEVKFARLILESLECDHKHTCQHCGACKCNKGKASDMKSTVAEAIKSGKLTEGKTVGLVFGAGTRVEKRHTDAKVLKITEGAMDIQVDGKSLTVDGSYAVTIRPDGNIDVFASDTDPTLGAADGAEDALAAAVGTEEDAAPEAGAAAGEGEALVAEEPVGGPTNKKEEDVLPESKVKTNETKLVEVKSEVSSIFVAKRPGESAGIPSDYIVCARFGDEPPVRLAHQNNESTAMEIGKNLASILGVKFEGSVGLDKVLRPDESKVNEEDYKGDPKKANSYWRQELMKHLAKQGDKLEPEEKELLAKAQKESVDSKDDLNTLDALIDLRMKEAITRAERDTLLEGRDVQVRVLSSRLSAATEEIAGLRSLVEKKVTALKESAKPNKDVQKLNESIKTQHTAHQKELVESAKTSIQEGRTQVLKDYFDRRLESCRLEADDNTQALLERCKSLDDVDHLIESLVRVAQRGALHPHSLKDVVVRERKTDPEQDKIDGQIGGLMQRWSA